MSDSCKVTFQPEGKSVFVLAGTSNYSPASSSCTGYSANGFEAVYSIDVPAGQSVDITYDAGTDNALYVVTACPDYDATTCVVGADDNFSAPYQESVTLTNSGGSTATYYVVADNFSTGACSDYTLTFSAFY